MAAFDVVTLGETMLRLTPRGLKRLEQATTLDIEVGGTESNLAIGLVRLGLRVVWISRLTDNPLGRLLARTIAGYGVDTSQVVWTKGDRVGVYFLEEGKPPRGSRVIYDRQQSAVSQMLPEELPVKLFRPDGARLLHLTGITFALGQAPAATAQHALSLAKSAGWLVSFDVNYRRQLWEPEIALQTCDPVARAADILFVPRGDACLLYGIDAGAPAEEILEVVATRYPQTTIVLTLGKDGAMGYEPQGQILRQPAFPAEEVERLGGGDAFAAGFLYSYLSVTATADRLPQALRWGAALAALKYGIPGDIPVVDRQEVEALLSQGASGPGVRR
jgi:2-dehydro-3-deoxygluconokinase